MWCLVYIWELRPGGSEYWVLGIARDSALELAELGAKEMGRMVGELEYGLWATAA